jgi:hypothetical protein
MAMIQITDYRAGMSESKKHTRYESTANRRQILSVRTSKGDDSTEWESIVEWLKELGDGKAKDGLYELQVSIKV